MQKSEHARARRYPWHFALFLMAYYITNAVYQGFVPLYFREVGMSTQQIGVLLAAVPLVSIFTQPMWGTLGDRMKSRNALLRVLAVCAALVVTLFQISDTLIYLLFMVSLFSCFYTAIQPMGDSIILEALHPQRQPFGPIRLAGGLSFAVASLVVGRVLTGEVRVVLYITAALLGLTCLSTLALPKTPGHQSGKRKMSPVVLLRQPHLTRLLTFMMLQQVTMGYFYAFFSVHFTSLPGGNNALLGWCYFISAVSEMPFLIFSDRLFQKLGAGTLLCTSAATLTLRWISLALLSDATWVMLTQVLHGWGFIVMTVSTSKYINNTVPPELKSSGQMLLAVVGYGIARVVGSLGGGLLASAVGMQNGYWVCAAITLGALVAFAPSYLGKPPLNGEARG